MSKRPEQKCTFEGCKNMGEPQEGFDFFVCDACFVEFERVLNARYAEAQKRHERN